MRQGETPSRLSWTSSSARLASVVAAERARGSTLFTHSGDTISTPLLSGIDKGAHIIDILNHMDVDALGPGNHEFDFGPEIFRRRVREAGFPVLAADIVMPEGGSPANTASHRVVEINGVRIGLQGLTTDTTPSSSSPEPIVFTDPVETASTWRRICAPRALTSPWLSRIRHARRISSSRAGKPL